MAKVAKRKRAKRTAKAGAANRMRQALIALGALAFVAAAAGSIYLQSDSHFGAGEGTPLAEGCIRDKSGFRALAGKPEFYVELTNACSQRARCSVHVNVTNSRGSKIDSGTLVLAAGAPGQETRATFATPTAEHGGMASMSRKCVGI